MKEAFNPFQKWRRSTAKPCNRWCNPCKKLETNLLQEAKKALPIYRVYSITVNHQTSPKITKFSTTWRIPRTFKDPNAMSTTTSSIQSLVIRAASRKKGREKPSTTPKVPTIKTTRKTLMMTSRFKYSNVAQRKANLLSSIWRKLRKKIKRSKSPKCTTRFRRTFKRK